MVAWLTLAHAALGAALLAFAAAERSVRAQAVRAAALCGGLLAALLFLLRASESSWRTLRLTPEAGAVVAIATGCSWILLAVYDERRGRIGAGVLVGVGATALGLFAANGWSVPALLFWMVLSAAVVALGEGESGRGWPWLVIGISDLCFVGGVVWHALAREAWNLPAIVDHDARWLFLAAALLRVGVAPRFAIWGYVGSPATTAIPLLVGSGFVVLARVGPESAQWVALALLVWSLGLAVWATVKRHADLALVGAWFGSSMVAVASIAPAAAPRAAATGLLAGTVAVLWPEALGRAQPERGLLFAIVPTTVGFGAVLAATVVSFDRATGAGAVIDAVPWVGNAVLLPIVLAFGIALGSMYGRRLEPERYSAIAVVATWGLLATAVVLGLSPAAGLGVTSEGPTVRGVWLHVVAVAAGVVAARWAAARGAPRVDVGELSGAVELGTPGVPRAIRRALPAAALLFVSLGVAATVWLTYLGLDVGFL